MKKEYISPDVAFLALSTCDIVTFSIIDIAGDIGENFDGNAMFGE